MDKLPRHIAIIMDGNGRWAQKRGLPRTVGHKKGVDVTRAIVRHAGEIGVSYLTLFAFSAENWSRPDNEVSDLMNLLSRYLKSESSELIKNNVRLRVIGNRERLSEDIIKMIKQLEEITLDNTGLNLTIALDYGGRQEILAAVRNTINDHESANNSNLTDEKIEKSFISNLYTHDLPDPDLLIRTSGEHRISNFLLWQCAYSEFYFTDILWPDFNTNDFDVAIEEYNNRDRRYGGTEKVQTS